MADTYTFAYRRGQQTFFESPTMVAVSAAPGRAGGAERALAALERRQPGTRMGRVGRFEVVEIDADAPVVREERARLAAHPSVGAAVPVYHTSDDGVPFVPEGTITVEFAEGTSDADAGALIAEYGLSHVGATRGGSLVLATTDGPQDAVEVAAALARENAVLRAQPDMVTPAQFLDPFQHDPLLERQWHLQNRGEHGGQTINYVAGADARVLAAWERLGDFGSENVIIGMIDDGFDLSHPDLAGKSVAPINFAEGGADVSPESDPDEPLAGTWHGTPCAGLAVGRKGGGETIGVAPNAKLMPVRMPPDISPQTTARWFEHVTDNGAWIVSCSWNALADDYELPDPIAEAITRCATQGRGGLGCVVVFAAGNSGTDINDPPNSRNGFAIHPDVIAVSASTSRDAFADYSSFGAEITVCAPSSGANAGWGITTIDVSGSYVDAAGDTRPMGYNDGIYTNNFKGTSAACPLVAGVCALVLGAHPALSAAEVREIIAATARKIGDAGDYVDGHSVKFGHGCINADAAIAEAIRRRGEPLIG